MYHCLQLLQWAVLLPMADVIATFDNCIWLVLLPHYDNCVWLVLLPSGWCYCHCKYSSCLADVVAMVAYGMPTIGCGIADVIIKVADGMATGSMFKFQF